MLSLEFGDFATWSAVFVAAVAITVQVISERQNKKIERRANAWSAINDQIAKINEACREASISPADAAQNPNEFLLSDFQSQEQKTELIVLFFHHLNLLHIVFLHQKFIEDSEINGFRNWSNNVIGSLLQAVPPLRATVKHVLDGEDLYSDEFLVFLRGMLATYLDNHPLE